MVDLTKKEFLIIWILLFCIPMAWVDKGDMFLEFYDHYWLFVWGLFSTRSDMVTLLPNISEIERIPARFLAAFWTISTVVSYFVLTRGEAKTLWRDIAILGVILIIQVLTPRFLFPLMAEGTFFVIGLVIPVPGPTAYAIILRAIKQRKWSKLSGV